MRIPCAGWFLTAAVFAVISYVGPESAAGDDGADRRTRFETIKAEYDKQFAAYRTASRAVITNAEREAADAMRPSLNAFARRFLDLAKEQPADEVSCDALLWIASNYAKDEPLETDGALDLLEKHHLDSPRLKEVVDALAYADSRRATALAETIAEKAGDRTVRGMARLFLAYAACLRTDLDDARNLAKVEDLLKRVKDEYADVRWEQRTLGDLAEAQLFEVRNLLPGKTAPALEGAGADGNPLKLSDFRGKVVLLVFWGSWCGPCMAEVPRLRELATRYADHAFTIVGVNSGEAPVQAATVIREEKMTWPVFIDGEEGPIARKWNVNSFPMVYVIDAAGVIRYKHLPDEFDQAVAEIVWEADQARRTASRPAASD